MESYGEFLKPEDEVEFLEELNLNFSKLSKQTEIYRDRFLLRVDLMGKYRIERGDFEAILEAFRACSEYVGAIKMIPGLIEDPVGNKNYQIAKNQAGRFEELLLKLLELNPQVTIKRRNRKKIAE